MSLGEAFTRAPNKRDRVLFSSLQKTCGAFQTYQTRHAELYSSGHLVLYYCEDGIESPNPYSRISLEALTVANNSDSHIGFSLVSSDGRKVKFICESLDAKRVWVAELHKQIEHVTDESSHTRALTSGPLKLTLDRSQPSLCEGFLQKRSGISSYHPRWCEVRRHVGIAYGKFKSSTDESFKILTLNGNRVVYNDHKFRIVVETGDDVYYFKCGSLGDYELWKEAIDIELGPEGSSPDTTKMRRIRGNNQDNVVATASESEIDAVQLDLDPPIPGGGSNSVGGATTDLADNDDEESIDGETLMELADLEAADPIHGQAESPQKKRSEMIRGKVIEIESVCREYKATKTSVECEAKLEAFLKKKLSYSLDDMVNRFQDKMFVPITHPYSAVNEHINLLDLDSSTLRGLLNSLLDEFGREEAAFLAIEQIDACLRMYSAVRERLVVRREIAQFREQAGKAGLKLGIDGTLHFIEKLVQKERGEPSKENWTRIREMVNLLYEALDIFRADYDVFDESEDTILDIEEGISAAETWLQMHFIAGYHLKTM